MKLIGEIAGERASRALTEAEIDQVAGAFESDTSTICTEITNEFPGDFRADNPDWDD